MKRTLPILLMLFVFGNCFSKPFFINLDKTIKYSKFCGVVTIKKYNLTLDSSIISIEVAPVSNPDSIFIVDKIFPNDFWGEKSKYWPKNRYPRRVGWVYWPDKNEKVLMILDSTKALCFFGEILQNKYRLYTFFFTGSATCIFSKYKFDTFRSSWRAKQEDGNYRYIDELYITDKDLKTKWKD